MIVSQVVQYDDRTVSLKLRTAACYENLHLSWHQTAARLCLGKPPDRGATSEAFAFGGSIDCDVVHSIQCADRLLCQRFRYVLKLA